jgi:hypothetical protein
MCLRFVYLVVVGVFSWLRLAGREASWKEAEILLLRHRLGVLERQQVRKPRLSWAVHLPKTSSALVRLPREVGEVVDGSGCWWPSAGRPVGAP